MDACSVDECGRSVHARGWCLLHYERWRRSGDPVTPGRILREPGAVCSVDDCDGPAGKGIPHTARGLCQKHYTRWLRHGDPLTALRDRPGRGAVCSVPGCDGPYRARGYCKNHYQRWLRHGDPLAVLVRTPRPKRVCSLNGCNVPARSRGLCDNHYQRWLKRGRIGPDVPLAPAALRAMARCRVCSHPESELIDELLDDRALREELPWRRTWGDDAPTCSGPGCEVRLVGKRVETLWCSKGCRSRAYRLGHEPPPRTPYIAKFTPHLGLYMMGERLYLSVG